MEVVRGRTKLGFQVFRVQAQTRCDEAAEDVTADNKFVRVVQINITDIDCFVNFVTCGGT